MAKRLSKGQRLLKLPAQIRKAQLINWTLVKGKKIPTDAEGKPLINLNKRPITLTFEKAVAVLENGCATGIGLPIVPNDFCGLDLDNCVHDREIDPWALQIIMECDSYTEFSPSGTGIHILMTETPNCPNARRLMCGNGHIDIFATNGYLTLTGKPVPRYGRKPLRRGADVVQVIFERIQPFSHATRKILEHRIMRDLWEGKWRRHYGSQSEADLALLGFIARYVDYEPKLIEQLFNQSGLCRKKWRLREDYRTRSIRKALEGKTSNQRDDDFILDRLVRVSEEKAANVQWLWKYRIPIGTFSAFAGDPEAGKGTIYCSMVAAVTTGDPWPDGIENAPQGPVVIFTTEDDVATVIKPRIIAAGGDPSKVFVMRDSFTFKHDLKAFEKMLKKVKPIWVIFDPGKPYIGTLKNAHDDAEIRAILDPVALLLAKHQVACTLIYHLTKDDGRELLHRLVGSIAHVAYPRAVWAIGENPRHRGQPRQRGFMAIKNNLYDKHKIGGLEFVIEGAPLEVDGETISDVPRARWMEGVIMMVAAEYFEKPKKKKRTAAQYDAEDILDEHGGQMSSVDLRQELADRGHAERTIRRAMENMDIERSHTGKKDRGQHRVKLKKRKLPR